MSRNSIARIRVTLFLSEELNRDINEIANSHGAGRSEVIRQAFALLKVAHQAKRDGKHLGIVADPEVLDTELVGLL